MNSSNTMQGYFVFFGPLFRDGFCSFVCLFVYIKSGILIFGSKPIQISTTKTMPDPSTYALLINLCVKSHTERKNKNKIALLLYSSQTTALFVLHSLSAWCVRVCFYGGQRERAEKCVKTMIIMFMWDPHLS